MGEKYKMDDNNLLTPEGMDRIAEQYENTLRSQNYDLAAEIKKARDKEVLSCINILKNYSKSERNYPASYLLQLLEKEMIEKQRL